VREHADLVADAAEALRRGEPPAGEVLAAALGVLEDVRGVATELRIRRALRLWDELWLGGGFVALAEVDERVAARVAVQPVTVRGWRCFRNHVVPQRRG
jgi:hypothetical protein